VSGTRRILIVYLTQAAQNGDAGVGRAQRRRTRRESTPARGVKLPLVVDERKPSTRDGLSGLVRPVVIVSGTTAA